MTKPLHTKLSTAATAEPFGCAPSTAPTESWDEYFAWAQEQDWGNVLKDRDQPMDDFISPFEKVAPGGRR